MSKVSELDLYTKAEVLTTVLQFQALEGPLSRWTRCSAAWCHDRYKSWQIQGLCLGQPNPEAPNARSSLLEIYWIFWKTLLRLATTSDFSLPCFTSQIEKLCEIMIHYVKRSEVCIFVKVWEAPKTSKSRASRARRDCKGTLLAPASRDREAAT